MLFTIFCGFRNIRFDCYSPQLKWNQAVLLLKQWRRLLLTSLKLSLQYHCRSLRNEDSFPGAKGCSSQFFAYSGKYVSIATLQSSNGIKSFFYSNNDDNFFQHRWNFRLNTICRSLRNEDWFPGAKGCCSQFFANSAKYVSIAILQSSNGIKPFFYSNNDDDFF